MVFASLCVPGSAGEAVVGAVCPGDLLSGMLSGWETCESPDGAEVPVAPVSAPSSLSVPRVLLAGAQGSPPMTPSPVPGPPGGVPGSSAPRAFGGMGPAACAFPASAPISSLGPPPPQLFQLFSWGNPPLSSACPSPPGRLQAPDLSPSRAAGGLMALFFRCRRCGLSPVLEEDG